MEKFVCRYEGNRTGRRSRDAEKLFDNTIKKAKQDQAGFAGRMRDEGNFFGPYSKNRGTTITAHVGQDRTLRLSCSNAGCGKRDFNGRCLEEKAETIPKELIEAARKRA